MMRSLVGRFGEFVMAWWRRSWNGRAAILTESVELEPSVVARRVYPGVFR
jgi:hypothetical protein